MSANSSVRYDLVGKIVAVTGLTRKAVKAILVGLEKAVFGQFGNNPEEFIIRASNIINEHKATAIIEHITYDRLNDAFGTEIFTEPALKKGCLNVNAMEAKAHCACEHFHAISGEDVIYDVVDSYDSLWKLVTL